jgi:hypothetical protein
LVVAADPVIEQRMIRKSVQWFSEKILRKTRIERAIIAP